MLEKQDFYLNKNVSRNIGKAISDFSMIHKNDRIMVGLSGGKDSNLLLYALCRLKSRSPVPFEIMALTVDPTDGKTDLDGLKDFTSSLNVSLDVTRYPIFDILDNSPEKSSCSLCANIRRGILASRSKELGCNVLALGHHRDDVIETVLLNLFYSGGFRCFHPNIHMSRSGIRVIRPLVYVSEWEIYKESQRIGFPIVDFNCKHSSSSRRMLIKSQIEDLLKIAPDLPGNIIHALKHHKQENTWVPGALEGSQQTGGHKR